MELDADLYPTGCHPLHVAAMRPNGEHLRHLLESGEPANANVDVQDRHGRSPLLVALQHGRMECARLLIQRGARIAGDPTIPKLLSLPFCIPLLESLVAESPVPLPLQSSHLLPQAAADGKREVLRGAVGMQGANVNHRDELGRTALHYACQNSHLACVELLVECGAEVPAIDSQFSTPLHLACSSGKLDVVRAVMSHCVDAATESMVLNKQNASGYTPCHSALYSKHYDIAAYLLCNFRRHVDLTLRDHNGHSLQSLHFALRFSRGFLSHGLHTQLPCLSEQEATWLLHCAISDKDLVLLHFAADQGANIHSFDLMQHDALLMASRTGFLNACKLLVARGAQVCTVDQAGLGPLHHAARGSHTETFSYLLTLQGIDVNGFYASWQEPLTANVAHALVQSLEQSASMPRPLNWVKWLCLVMPCADEALYAAFVELACPANWTDILADPSRYPPDDISCITRVPGERTTISVCGSGEPYTPDLPLHMSKLPHRLLNCSTIPRVSRHNRCHTPQVCVQKATVRPVHSAITAQGQHKNRPFCLPKKRHSFYPLHLVVLAKNKVAFCHTLSCAAEHTRSKLVSLVDDSGCTVYELMLRHPEVFGEQLKVLPIPECLSNKLQSLTWSTLLQYIISGRPSALHTILKQKKCSISYDHVWPHWCYVLKANEYCRMNGIPDVSLGLEVDQIRLASHILTTEVIDLNHLLYVAVENRCHWAIPILLEKGASSVTCSDGKFALCTAITGCDLGVIDALLKQGVSLFVSHGGDNFFPSLFSALLTMAHNGWWNKVLQILTCIPNLNTLPIMSACRNLFRASLQVKGGCDIAAFLLRPFLSMLYHVVTNWLSLTETNHHTFLLQLRHIQQSLRGSKNIATDRSTFKRIVSFCDNRSRTMSTILHQLCAAGNTEEVRMLLCSGCDASLLCLGDPHNALPPLLCAVASGHLDMLTMCVEKFGCSPPPACVYLCGILYLALSPDVHLTSQAQHSTKQKFKGSHFTHCILETTKLLSSYLFSPVTRDPAALHTFVVALNSLCPDRRSLFCAQGEHLVHILLLISLIPDLTPLQPFLKEMQECLSSDVLPDGSRAFASHQCAFNGGTSSLHAQMLTSLQAILESTTKSYLARVGPYVYLQDRYLSTCQSVLDFAVNMATLQTCTTGAGAFDDVLAQYAVCNSLTSVNIAASKGLWKVVEVAGQNLTKLHQLQESYSLGTNYYDALCMALRNGKRNAANAIYDAFFHAMRESEHLRHLWQHKLLRVAVRYDLIEYIIPIVAFESFTVNKALLDTIARYSSKEALQVFVRIVCGFEAENYKSAFFYIIVHLASKYNRAHLLEYLLYLVQSSAASVSEDDSGPTWSLSFWCHVLSGAAKGGKECLALQAVACIPERNLRQLCCHHEYLAILHWCGHWGLADLLECIPFSEDDIFMHNADVWPSAWESAVANGHIGSLCSRVPNFPLLPSNLQAWMKKSYISITTKSLSSQEVFVNSLLTGSFHRLMTNAAGRSSGPKVHIFLHHSMREGQYFALKYCNSGYNSFFYYGCWYGVTPMVEACLETLGKLAGHVLHYLHESKIEIIHRVCRLRGSFSLLQTLLKALFEADLLNTANNLDCHGQSPLALATLAGEVENIKALLQSGPRSVLQFSHRESKDNLLHYAVMSRNPLAVRVICGALGKEMAILCLRNNSAGICPLQLAFAMGHHSVASELMSLATVRDKVIQESYMQVIITAKQAFGWFGLMMKRNESVATDTTRVCSPINIRKCRNLPKLLACALKARHTSLVLSIFDASVGLVLDNKVLPNALLNPQMFAFLKTNHSIHPEMLGQPLWTRNICSAIGNGQAFGAVQVTRFLISNKVTLDFEKLFEVACYASDSCFLRFLLEDRLLHKVPQEILSRGLSVTAALTRLETGLTLQSELGVKLDNADNAIPLAPMSNVLFSSNLDYFHILNSFFQSTVQQSSLLPTLWLTHRWTNLECEYIDRYCRGKTQCNPWQLTTNVKLHVEWNSFFQVMTTSDKAAAPLWVEAVVFSRAVVGQFCNNLQQFSNIATVTLTCHVWPAIPVAFVCNDKVRILLCYSPMDNSFVFPKCFTPKPVTAVKDLQYDQVPTKRYLLKDSITNLAHSIARSITKTFFSALLVKVQLDQTLSNMDPTSFERYFAVVRLLLEDFHLALRLVRRSFVRHSFVSCAYENSPIFTPDLYWTTFITSVTIVMSVVSGNSELKVGFNHKALEVEICIGSDVHEWIKHWYECLLREVSTHLCEMEFEHRRRNALKFVYNSFLPKLCKISKSPLCRETVTLCALETLQGSVVNLTEASVACLPYVKHFNKIKNVLLTFIDMVKIASCKPYILSHIRQHLSTGIHIVLNNFEHSRLFLQNGSFQLSVNLDEMDCNAVDCLYRDMLEACVPSRSLRSFKTLGSGYIARHACYIDWRNSPGLLYPVLGCKKTISFYLVDYTKQVLTSTGGCTIEIQVVPPEGERYSSAISSTDLILSTVDWTPQSCGPHRVGILVNKLHIGGSPVAVFVSIAECERSSVLHIGSGGVRQTTAGTSLVFIASHPPGQCDWTTPALVRPGNSSTLGLEASPLPQHIRPSSTKQLLCSSSSHSPSPAQLNSQGSLHYLSICSKLGKTKDWVHHSCPHVQVLTLGTLLRGQKCVSVPLGCGRFRIALRCCVNGTFRVLAVCASCQAVMCIHWADQQEESLPLQCYVLPGPMSPAQCVVSTRKSFSMSSEKARFGPYTVGVPFTLYLKARDEFGNPHSAGGSKFCIFIKKGEKGSIAPNMTLDEIHIANRATSRGDIACIVHYEDAGVYRLTCKAFSTGVLDLIATVQEKESQHVVALVAMSSGDPYAPHCRLELSSGTAIVNEPFVCRLYTFDRWGNPCSAETSMMGLVATCNSQAATISHLLENGDNSNVVMISFTPCTHGRCILNVTVNGEQVHSSPMELDVAPHNEAFSQKVKQLLAHLRLNHACGLTPTLNIKRGNILGSAMEAMQPYTFHQVVRVRFDDEPGIDAGGIVKEFFHLLSLEVVNPNYNLFHFTNGLCKPSPSSDVNPNHLFYFSFFGKILAKAICDGHQLVVRFTPSVYKFLLGAPCSLDDVKLENLPLYLSLVEILHCETQEQLAELSMTFDVNVAHFGKIETIELVKGGSTKEVTIQNRQQFVSKMYQWNLTGCINRQLSSMKEGFNLLIPDHLLKHFSAYELEMVISGLRTIDVKVVQQRTKYTDYSKDSPVIVWLWEVLFAFNEEEKSRFLQFTTGCACLPCDDMGEWELHIKKCSYASNVLPMASTCFNVLSLPEYPSKEVLKEKLILAITFGAEAFLYH